MNDRVRAEVEFRFSRSSGPGGQNVNKRDTRVEAILDVAGSAALSPAMKRRAIERLGSRLDARSRLRVVSGAARTQPENRAAALARLDALLRDALRPPPKPRRPTTPTRAAKERRLSSKKARAETKRHRQRPQTDSD